MRRIFPLLALLLLITLSALAQEVLYHKRSIDMGFKDFDLTVTETKRAARTSVLHVPGFQKRSAAASRWLMCVYTDLAIQRGFKFWVVVYPEQAGEDLLVGFPQSQDEKCSETLGKEFASRLVFPNAPASVETFIAMCGMKFESKK